MDNHTAVDGFKGIMVTFILWITGKIFWLLEISSIAQLASMATIVSAIIVAIANAPRAYQAIKDFFKKPNQS